MSSSGVRTATLAFALASWVEGLTQIRTVLLTPGLRRQQDEDTYEPPPLSSDASWRDRIVAWLTRNGRQDGEIDDKERACLGVVDITTAFIALHLLKQPLLPYLLSPFLATFPIPRPTSSSNSVKLTHLAFSTVVLSLIHEAQRVSVSMVVDRLKKHREAQIKSLLGEVYVRGHDLRPRDDDEDDEECLICAGAGADNPMSQSISSLSSMATASSALDALGPLEAFCSLAPQKHVAHRTCFLSWHAAYHQQRTHLAPDYVLLEHPNPTESVRAHAQAVVEAAGFSYLGRFIRFVQELPGTRVFPPNSEGGRPLLRPTLTMAENLAGPSSPNASRPRLLATLHTTTPPCPGCRSSVLLHFHSRTVPRPRDDYQQTRRAALKTLMRLWIHHWGNLVTGKTLLYRLASQCSFIMILISVIHVGGPRRHV
ncbi:hypothetical protein BU17DRAFT_79163 [Hysterangium stoloniferum]|nr:hypothetical protein BU17DRAFT_79163 [Hysterangium stoloniferum]